MNNPNFYPYEIKDLDPELNKELLTHWVKKTGFIRLGPHGYLNSREFRNEAGFIYNMALRSDDIFVVTFPRSGTTWTQEMVWMIANDLNYKKAVSIPLTQRYHFLEYYATFQPDHNVFREQNKDNPDILSEFNSTRGKKIFSDEIVPPRFFKTHLAFSLLPPALLDMTKVVYVARDPRDVAVSYYFYHRTFGQIDFDFKTFWSYFIGDLVLWSPYFEHLKEAWVKRNHPNMLFIFYEDMKKDLESAVLKVAKFFGKELTNEELLKLVDHLSFDTFKSNKSVNRDEEKKLGILVPGEAGFIRRDGNMILLAGEAGGWREYFDEELSAQAQRWIADNLLDTDLRFPHMQLVEFV